MHDRLSTLRIGLVAVLAGAAVFLALSWALRPQPAPPSLAMLTPAQRQAYEQGFQICQQRVIAGVHPQGNDEWNAVLHQFEVCTAKLGVPFKTRWEPEENKWRYEIVYPEH